MLNSVTLMGRLTADPELRTTDSGTEVTSFSIAVERSYADENKNRKVDFFTIVAWRNFARVITTYFHKGMLIGIQGNLQTRTFVDKDGNNRKAVDVVANTISFCGDNKKKDAPANQEPVPQDFTVLPTNDDDLPF